MLLTVTTIFTCIFHINYATNYDEDGWKAAATFLKEGYNDTIKPCEDFMGYACSSWLNTLKTKNEESSTTYTQATTINNMLAKAIADIDIEDKKTPKFKKAVRTFYDSCTKSLNLNYSAAAVELFNTLIKLLNVPPILAKDKKEKDKVLTENIWHVLGQVQRDLPIAAIFFSASIMLSKVDSSKTLPVLVLSPITNEIERLDPEKVLNDTQYLAKALHKKVDMVEMKRKIKNMVHFDTELAQFYNVTEEAVPNAKKSKEKSKEDGAKKRGKRQDGEGNAEAEDGTIPFEKTISLDLLQSAHGNISWVKYFQGLFSKEQYASLNHSAPLLYVKDLAYFENLQKMLSKFDTETVFNYIFYRAMITYYDLIKEDVKENKTSDSLECVDAVKTIFTTAATRIIFDHNKMDAVEWKNDLDIMFETVVSGFKFLVAGSDWLDYEDKMAVIKKVNGYKFYSGVPDWLNDDKEVEARTAEFDKEKSTVSNLINLLKINFDRNLDYIVGLRDINADEEPNLDINAGYLALSVMLQVGIALPPFYQPKYPLAVKYGIMGYTIGHEIMHGFDADRVKEIPSFVKKWLKPETLKIFAQKRDCLIKQYSSYCFKKEQECLSGRATITENMADIDGLKIAYMAYKFATQTIGEEPPLPGFLDFTADQMFFLSAARSYCSTGIDVPLILLVNDEHAPDQTRLEVPFRNFPLFAKTFKCTLGSNYAPLGTCSVWGAFNAGNKLNRY